MVSSQELYVHHRGMVRDYLLGVTSLSQLEGVNYVGYDIFIYP